MYSESAGLAAASACERFSLLDSWMGIKWWSIFLAGKDNSKTKQRMQCTHVCEVRRVHGIVNLVNSLYVTGNYTHLLYVIGHWPHML